ncbi:MAG: hypothetical protein RLZZ230_669 [Candidatus Parcubacteria bacterium]|jgi:NADH:ubiquinone oxidoreductase subunit K
MTKRVLKRVFGETRYVIGALIVVFLAMTGSLLLPNAVIIKQILSSSILTLSSKISFVASLYGTLFSSNTIFSGLILVITALMFGINIGLLVYYIRRRQEKGNDKKAHFASLGGLISAVLGMGCAACGSVVLTAVFGMLGAGSLVYLLPFKGAEFGVLGIILLGVSIQYLIKRINDPMVCPIE